MNTKKEWKLIKQFPTYEISNWGEVRNIKTKRIKKQTDMRGYKCVALYSSEDKKSYMQYVQRLVADYFIPNPRFLELVGWHDNDKSNNNVDNLYWMHRSDLDIDWLTWERVGGRKHHYAKINEDIAKNIRQLWDTDCYTVADLARHFKISTHIIYKVINNTTWKNNNNEI